MVGSFLLGSSLFGLVLVTITGLECPVELDGPVSMNDPPLGSHRLDLAAEHSGTLQVVSCAAQQLSISARVIVSAAQILGFFASDPRLDHPYWGLHPLPRLQMSRVGPLGDLFS